MLKYHVSSCVKNTPGYLHLPRHLVALFLDGFKVKSFVGSG